MSDTDNDQAQEQDQSEREARRQGWRPQEEFRGDADDWVDARTFIRRGKEIRGVMKSENEELKRQLAAANGQIGEMKGTIEEIRQYHSDMEKRAIAAAMKEMKKQRIEALEAGNHALVGEIDEEIQELKDAPRLADKVAASKEVNKPVPQTPPEMTPAIKAWHSENSAWYNEDEVNEDLVAFTNGYAQKLSGRKDLDEQGKLDALTAKVKATFPDRFGSSRRNQPGITPGAGEGGGGSGSRKTGKGAVSALPVDAKAAGERFVKQGLYKSIEAYAEEYFAQPGAR